MSTKWEREQKKRDKKASKQEKMVAVTDQRHDDQYPEKGDSEAPGGKPDPDAASDEHRDRNSG